MGIVKLCFCKQALILIQMAKPNKVLQYIFYDKKKRFILKQSCISELQVNYLDNHVNNLQFAIQSTI